MQPRSNKRIKEMEEKKSLTKSISLPNDVAKVPELAEFVDGVCEEAGLDMPTTMQLNLAVEEAVVNVMDYAYPAGTEGEVLVDAKVEDGLWQIVITDHGAPFDPTAKAEVDTTLPAEQRKIGGLGIHLIRNIMDEVSYMRVGDSNVLTLKKKIQ